MAKKKPESEKRRTVIQIRCTDAAVAQTGHVSLTSWVLYTLRNAAKESSRHECWLKRNRDDSLTVRRLGFWYEIQAASNSSHFWRESGEIVRE